MKLNTKIKGLLLIDLGVVLLLMSTNSGTLFGIVFPFNLLFVFIGGFTAAVNIGLGAFVYLHTPYVSD